MAYYNSPSQRGSRSSGMVCVTQGSTQSVLPRSRYCPPWMSVLLRRPPRWRFGRSGSGEAGGSEPCCWRCGLLLFDLGAVGLLLFPELWRASAGVPLVDMRDPPAWQTLVWRLLRCDCDARSRAAGVVRRCACTAACRQLSWHCPRQISMADAAARCSAGSLTPDKRQPCSH